MEARDFVYWLQGFSELNVDGKAPTNKQWQIIQDHLNLVFNKVTPDRNKSSIDDDLEPSISKEAIEEIVKKSQTTSKRSCGNGRYC